MEKLSIKFKLFYNVKNITSTKGQSARTFVIIPRPIFLRTRNISNKYAQKIKTHFVQQRLFFWKIVPFMRYCGKIFYSRTGHRLQYNMAHAPQMLDNYCYRDTLTIIYIYCFSPPWDRGGTVVKVLCYKLEGRWFDSRWCHWNFSLT